MFGGRFSKVPRPVHDGIPLEGCLLPEADGGHARGTIVIMCSQVFAVTEWMNGHCALARRCIAEENGQKRRAENLPQAPSNGREPHLSSSFGWQRPAPPRTYVQPPPAGKLLGRHRFPIVTQTLFRSPPHSNLLRSRLARFALAVRNAATRILCRLRKATPASFTSPWPLLLPSPIPLRLPTSPLACFLVGR